MNKSYRQGQILKLIAARRVNTQEELAQQLGAIGILTTQVTLSRDIRELGLVKTPQGYSQTPSTVPQRPDVASVAREFLIEVRVAQNLLVLRTPPATANVLASALDHSDWQEITGTLAGDDTVLVIAPSNAAAQLLEIKLSKYLK